MNEFEFLEYCYKQLNEALEVLGTVHLTTDITSRHDLKKIHNSYDVLFDLRNRIRLRIEKEKSTIEGEEND